MTKFLKLFAVLLFTTFAAATLTRTIAARDEAGVGRLSAGLAQGQAGAAPPEKTAAQAYRNIRVFKELPASQLLGAMNYMTGALGVGCNHCHAGNAFAGDDKPAKQTARRHIQMMGEINAQNFGGQVVVNCATCHRGQAQPASVISLSPAALQPAAQKAGAKPPASLPTVDQVLDKYLGALGGKERAGQMKTLTMKGSRTMANGNDPPSTERMEVYRKAPDRMLMIFTGAGGAVSTQAYDGTLAWRGSGGKATRVGGMDLAGAKRDADFYKDINLKDRFPAMTVTGSENVGGREAYVVEATLAEDNPARMLFGVRSEKLYFDAQTGLLVRRYMEYKTPLGALPEATDFEDYRSVGGVMLPFTVRFSRPPFTMIQRLSEIKVNAPVGDEKFHMPGGK